MTMRKPTRRGIRRHAKRHRHSGGVYNNDLVLPSPADRAGDDKLNPADVVKAAADLLNRSGWTRLKVRRRYPWSEATGHCDDGAVDFGYRFTAADGFRVTTGPHRATHCAGATADLRPAVQLRADAELLSSHIDVLRALLDLQERSGWTRIEVCRHDVNRSRIGGDCVDDEGRCLKVTDLL